MIGQLSVLDDGRIFGDVYELDRPNPNGRVYGRQEVLDAIDYYSINNKPILGFYGANNNEARIDHAVISVDELYEKDGFIIAVAKILKTREGAEFLSKLNRGVVFGFSSCGYGYLHYSNNLYHVYNYSIKSINIDRFCSPY